MNIHKERAIVKGFEDKCWNRKYYDDIKVEYDALMNKMISNKKTTFKIQDEIKEFLKAEIVSRYYFQKGRIEASFIWPGTH